LKHAKWIILFVLLVLFAGVTVFATRMGTMDFGGFGGPPPRVTIQGVSFGNINNCTISIAVKSNTNATILFNQALIRNQNGSTVDTVSFNTIELPRYKVLNFTINLNKSLSSGIRYIIDLRTTENDNFQCGFGIPEKIAITKITLSNSNTLLLEVQSLTNRPLVFDTAKIREWIGNEFVKGSMGYITDIEDTGVLSPTELMPHENTTLTVTLKNGLSCGNYSFELHSPEQTYITGEKGDFTITGVEQFFNRDALIKKVSFDEIDNNTLLLDVQSLSSQTIVFTGATIKESISRYESGNVYAVIASGSPVPTELSPQEAIRIAVSLKAHQGSYATSPVSFRSGNYTVTLNSLGSPVWTSFTIPLVD
jgi:hypothetical protein